MVVTKLSLMKSLLQSAEKEHNPLAMSDEQILELIYSTNVQSDTRFDVDSLFTLVENTLRRSTSVVDNLVEVNAIGLLSFSSSSSSSFHLSLNVSGFLIIFLQISIHL